MNVKYISYNLLISLFLSPLIYPPHTILILVASECPLWKLPKGQLSWGCVGLGLVGHIYMVFSRFSYKLHVASCHCGGSLQGTPCFPVQTDSVWATEGDLSEHVLWCRDMEVHGEWESITHTEPEASRWVGDSSNRQVCGQRILFPSLPP